MLGLEITSSVTVCTSHQTGRSASNISIAFIPRPLCFPFVLPITVYAFLYAPALGVTQRENGRVIVEAVGTQLGMATEILPIHLPLWNQLAEAGEDWRAVLEPHLR